MVKDLCGVGTKYEIEVQDGKVAVIYLESGGIQLYVLENGSKKPCCVTLTVDEARRIGSILMGSILEKEEEGVEVSLPGVADLRIAVHMYQVPKKISGKSIGELKIRSSTGATVIAVLKRDRRIVNPSPETALEEGDTVVVIGEKNHIEKFEKLIWG